MQIQGFTNRAVFLRLPTKGPGWDQIVRELEVLMIRGQVHPLGLPKHQKGAQPQVADDGHQVENTRPGASGLNQVATQIHAYHTWTREAETDSHFREAGPAHP